ncbi:MAG: hypothetical protein WC655_19235 [Candidatus Hydrogenedentales bacterium]|jgi:hypothetical protein
MPRNSEYKIETDVKKALADIQTMSTKFKEMEVAIGNVGKASKKSKEEIEKTPKHVDSLSTSFKSAALAATGMVTSALSLRGALAILEKYEAHLDAIKGKSDAAAIAIKPLAVQLAGIPGGPAERKRIERMGAAQGLTPDQIGQIGNTVKSIQGATMTREFPIAAVMSNMGVSPEAASQVVQAGVVRGIGSGRASDLVIGAADLAPIDVPGIANALPSTIQFSSMETGLAAAAALRTAGMPTEQLPTSLKAAARALGKDESNLAKKFKLQGLPETERIARLRSAAEASGNVGKFSSQAYLSEKFGLGEEEAAAVGMLIQNSDKFRESESTLRKTPPLATAMRFKALMTQNPDLASEYEARIAKESSGFRQRYGSGAEAARLHEARQQALGMEFTREHPALAPWLVEDGKPGYLLRASDWLDRVGGGGDTRPVSVAIREQARADWQNPEAWRSRESSAATADPENTKATQELTKETRGLRDDLRSIAGVAKVPRDRNAGL